MDAATTFRIYELKRQAKNISNAICHFYSEALQVALERNHHQSGISLKVIGDFNKTIKLLWAKRMKNTGHEERRVLVEMAAYGIAFYLVTDLTEYEIIQQGLQGDGFDYWLGYKESNPKYDPDNFLNAGLEVSGIFNDSLSVVERRVKDKIAQVRRKNPDGFSTYIVVTEFGQPLSKILKV